MRAKTVSLAMAIGLMSVSLLAIQPAAASCTTVVIDEEIPDKWSTTQSVFDACASASWVACDHNGCEGDGDHSANFATVGSGSLEAGHWADSCSWIGIGGCDTSTPNIDYCSTAEAVTEAPPLTATSEPAIHPACGDLLG